jgi:predicted metal-binding membrane protein
MSGDMSGISCSMMMEPAVYTPAYARLMFSMWSVVTIAMALLFFGGLMNLYWITGMAVFVLLGKTVPYGHWIGRVAGLVLIAWGVCLPLAKKTLPICPTCLQALHLRPHETRRSCVRPKR